MTLYSFLLALLPCLYVGWRLSRAVFILLPEGSRSLSWAIPLLLLLLNVWPLVILYSYFSQHLSSLFLAKSSLTVWDYLLLYPFWLGLIIVVELVPYYLILDTVHIGANLFSRNAKENWIRWLSLGKVVLFILFSLYVVIRSYRDTDTIRLKKYDIKLDKQLPGLNNLNLLLSADIQVDRYTGEIKLNRLQRRMDACRPDILFFAGDLVTGGRDYIEQGLNFICARQARLARIACLGDHDLWSDAGTIGRGFKNCGWQFIQNGHYTVDYRGCRIVVTVLTHVYSQRISRQELHSVLSSKPAGDLYILLVHQPAHGIIEAAEAAGYDIFLAGHTHGGQVVFNPLGIDITPSQFENPHYSGYKKFGKMNVFVTNGVGLTMMPLRFRAPAEVMDIQITGKF
jgi:predicted MPP superfamily phosphohydrolase